MPRTAPFLRFSSLMAVIWGAVFLFIPPLHTAVSAAPFPSAADSPTTPGAWVINEFHADPASDISGDANGDGMRDAGHDEFIELFNDTGAAADISGWTLADEFVQKHIFPPGSIVPDQCAIIVFGGGLPVGAFGYALVQTASSGGLGLDNTGDTITLSDGPNTIRSLTYGFEGNEDQALTRDPDVSGPFVGHLTAAGSRFSPGTRLDGSLFAGCDTPPVLLEMQPADSAVGVAINSTIALTFSEPVAFNTPWYEIACTKSGSHTAVISGGGASFSLTPEPAFVYGETCQITLFGAAISDLDGQPQPMEGDVQWQFATESETDSAPQVVDSFPADGAIGIARVAAFSLTFSEPVSLAPTAVTLSCTHSGNQTPVLSGGPLQFAVDPQKNLEKGELCTLAVAAGGVSDLDTLDPPDQMAAGWQISFSSEAADFLLINEIDSETPGVDDAEFIELFDGGRGRTRLDGLSIILFSGHNDGAYAGYDLSGRQTDDNGYFLLGSSTVAGVDLVLDDTRLQNGADAVALYHAPAAQMPLGTAVTTENLLDALVYGTGQAADAGLLPLLLPGEAQVNENARTLDDFHSLQRCPGGSGGQRRTGTYWPDWPTPKTANTCVKDEAPRITATSPQDGAVGVALDSDLLLTFSEAVAVNGQWFEITCQNSGSHDASISAGAAQVTLHPAAPFTYGEQCQVTIFADQVSDQDAADPPDHLEADYSWTFSTTPARHILINEVDADTPGVDTAEFIELYDGGQGDTPLDGLLVVLFNGATDLSYRAIDLVGQRTDEQGRFVIGSTAVPGVDLVLPDGAVQNGADAVALYEGSKESFPYGSSITTANLLDALVYGAADEPDSELLALLAAGEQQLDENGRGNATGDSNQRCPDGAGGQRRSASFLPNLATPDGPNKCSYDEAPALLNTTPGDGEGNVAVDTSITLNFSEAVDLAENWFAFVCEKSGSQAPGVRHTENQVILKPHADLLHNDVCTVTVLGAGVRDSDLDDPPDRLAGDYAWSFETAALPAARHILINEVDADTPGVDTAEFIELYDGGQGDTQLDGLVVVLFNGAADLSYRAIDLVGQRTDEQGRFVIGSTAVPGVDLVLPDGAVQNGPDAVALYEGSKESFPYGSSITTANLLDAVVYGAADEPDNELLALLAAGEQQLDENGRGNATGDSNQRCPDGAGGQRRSGSFLQNRPTPKAANFCQIDSPPRITGHDPADGASEIALDAGVSITFSEGVSLDTNSILLQCSKSGVHELAISGGPLSFALQPHNPLSPGDSCTVTVLGDKVSDLDDNDPPDNMAGDFSWSFETAALPAARHILINEVDADTPGVDTAEFIELYDGGQGDTPLDGLVVVLFNGSDELSYRAIDLDGYGTDAGGYFVIGSASVPGAGHLLGSGALQNGPDAVALFVGDAGDFTRGTAVTTANLLDALVYSTGDENAPGLLRLLRSGETIVDEDGRGARETHANQRCPNGAGGQRRSGSFLQNKPTPRAANFCQIDSPPRIAAHVPADGADDITLDAGVSITFSEGVSLMANSVRLQCSKSGLHDLAISGGPLSFTLQPHKPLSPGDNCTVTVLGDKVSDLDKNDPPDNLDGNYAWSFAAAPVPLARHLLINEVDADTPGADKAEFIELYDGGEGGTALDGLQVILFNGATDRAYRHIDLAGRRTDAKGYFVIGSSAVDGVDLVIANGAIQNGPDAVALYVVAETNGKPDEKGLLDALVYHTNDKEDTGLSFLLLKDEPQLNEGQLRDPALDSNQRCPNGQGGRRVTTGYVQNQPTAGTANNCTVDTAPAIIEVFPADGTQDVPLNSSLVVRFDEPVQVDEGWIALSCAQEGLVDLAITGGPEQYTLQPAALAPLDHCTAAIKSDSVHDLDGQADALAGDYGWQFTTGKGNASVSAAFSSSSPVTIGAPVQFINASQGPPPLTYAWDFGDGSPLVNEANPAHLYTAVGTYRVTLTVKTSWGETAVATGTVEILPLRIFVPLSLSP